MNKKLLSALLMTVVLVMFLLPVALSGCGEEQSPGAVVEELFQAYNDRDFSRAYDLSSEALKETAGTKDEAIAQMEASWPEGTEVVDLQILSEQIDGDQAIVEWAATIKSPDIPEEQASASVKLSKEDGEWRLSS